MAARPKKKTKAKSKPGVIADPDSLGAILGKRKPSAVATLDLSRKGLERIPDLSRLTGLKRLLLNGNRLTEVRGLRYCVNLEEIALYINELESIPDGLFDLPRLEKLDLRFLPLTELPGDIRRLTKLKHLSLCGTKLTELPKAVFDLDLTELRLSGVAIEDLSGIGKLKRLALLWINETKLPSIPKELTTLTKLSRLRVSPGIEGLDEFKRRRPNCLVQEERRI